MEGLNRSGLVAAMALTQPEHPADEDPGLLPADAARTRWGTGRFERCVGMLQEAGANA
jgi:hypothetical protein